ncbi:putative membrane protein [Helicobacter pylori NQ4216]|nr:putative membrane protein [Helicobacter pylori NQ4216]
MFLRFFTAYNFCLLFHLVFCLLDFDLIVFRVLFFLNLISFV